MDIDDLVDSETEYREIDEEFYDERLARYDGEKRRWATAIDTAAQDIVHGIAIGSTESNEDIGGTIGKTDFPRAVGPYYVDGLEALSTDSQQLAEIIADYEDEAIGRLGLKLTELRHRLQVETRAELSTDSLSKTLESLVEKLTTKEVRSGALRQPLRETEAVVDMLLQLFGDPTAQEFTDVLVDELTSATENESVLSLVDEPQLTTPLWEHQEEALERWIQNDRRGYVNMATATGKTVLGLSAIAYHFGGLHPANAASEFTPATPRSRTGDMKVLIVAGRNLLLDQWQAEFEAHMNIPPHRSEATETTRGRDIKLSWGTVHFKTSQQLAQDDLVETYDLVILDEAHRYSKGSSTNRGWRDTFEGLSENTDDILAMSGSTDAGWIGDQSVEAALQENVDEIYTFTLPEARSEGIVADFSWNVAYVPAISDESLDELVDVTQICAAYFRDPSGPEFGELKNELENTDITTIKKLRSFANTTEGRELRSQSDEFDRLANAAFSRATRRWQLTPTVDSIVQMLEKHADEQCIVLVQSYEFAAAVEDALQRAPRGWEIEALTDNNVDPAASITEFNDGEGSILVGPGSLLGTGIDLPDAEVAVNVGKGGVNSSLIQRIGRVLRNPSGEKDATFYHLDSVPTEAEALLPTEDGRRFLDRICSFHLLGEQMEEMPNFSCSDSTVEANLTTLETSGIASYERLPDAIPELASSSETGSKLEELLSNVTDREDELDSFAEMGRDDSLEPVDSADTASDEGTGGNISGENTPEADVDDAGSSNELDEREYELVDDVGRREPVADDVLIDLWDLESSIALAKILKGDLDEYLTRNQDGAVCLSAEGRRQLGGDVKETSSTDDGAESDEESDSGTGESPPETDDELSTSERSEDDFEVGPSIEEPATEFVEQVQAEFSIDETTACRLVDLYLRETPIDADELVDGWQLADATAVYKYLNKRLDKQTKIVGLGAVKLSDDTRTLLDSFHSDSSDSDDTDETDSQTESEGGTDGGTKERHDDVELIDTDDDSEEDLLAAHYSLDLSDTDREALGEELRLLSDHALYPPSEETVITESEYPLGAFIHTFGSYEDALRLAGYKIDDKTLTDDTSREYRPSEVVATLQVISDVLWQSPSADLFDTLAPMQGDAAPILGEDWPEILAEAGLKHDELAELKDGQETASRDTVVETVVTIAEEIGSVPKLAPVAKECGVSRAGVLVALGSEDNEPGPSEIEPTANFVARDGLSGGSSAATERFAEAVDGIGSALPGYYSIVERLPTANLLRVGDSQRELDIATPTAEADTENASSADSTATAAEETTVVVDDRLRPEYDVPLERRLIDDLRRLHREFGHSPRPSDVEKYGRFGVTTHVDEFGTWDEALAQINDSTGATDPDGDDHDEELLIALGDLTANLGHRPTTRNIDELTDYSATTYVSRFGSMNRAIEAADIDVTTVDWAIEIVDDVSESWDSLDEFGSSSARERAGIEALLLLKRGWIGTDHELVTEIEDRLELAGPSIENVWQRTLRPVLTEAEQRGLVTLRADDLNWAWSADEHPE